VARFHQVLLADQLVEPSRRAAVAGSLAWGLQQMDRSAESLEQAVGLVHEGLRPLIVAPFQRVRQIGSLAA
jgi:hypothetical protein